MNEQHTILVIEDDQNTASILEDSLTLGGFSVKVIMSATEAIRKIEHLKPNLITLDIKMLGISGMDLLKDIKGNEKTKHIPVIMISGVDHSYGKECIEMGASAFFQKPLDFTKLRETIRNIIEENLS